MIIWCKVTIKWANNQIIFKLFRVGDTPMPQYAGKPCMFFFVIPRSLLWGIPPHPNLSFSLAQRKELKETSTYPKSFPIWKDYRIIANPLLSRCFCKAGRRLVFSYGCALILRGYIAERDNKSGHRGVPRYQNIAENRLRDFPFFPSPEERGYRERWSPFR